MNQPVVRFELKLVLGALLVAIAAMWAYAGTTQGNFVWDSVKYLFEYQDHLSALNMDNMVWMFTTLEFSNWHPLTWLSWAIDYQLWGGLNAWGFHFSNNLLHAINSILLIILILAVLGLDKPMAGSYPFNTQDNALLGATLTALIFALHPQHVESVAWVAERKDLLCQFFMLLTLLSYLGYVSCEPAKKTGWYLLSLVMFSLALMSKPMAVTLPALLLLIDVYPLRRTRLVASTSKTIQPVSWPRLLLEKTPFFLLTFFLALITLVAQQEAMVQISLDLRVLNAFSSINMYLAKLLVPINFSPHYAHFLVPGEALSWRAFLPLAAVIAVTLMAVFAWFKNQHAWLIAWLFYLVALSPVIGLVQVGLQGAADRYAYFPTLPFYLLLAGGIFLAMKNVGPAFKLMLIGLLLSSGLLLANNTRRQVEVWHDEINLWSQAVRFYPDSVFILSNLGIAYLDRGDYDNAARNFEAAGDPASRSISLYAWRGLTYLHQGRLKEALSEHVNLGAAAEINTSFKVDQYCIQYNIGWIYAQSGLNQEALELFARVDPDSASGEPARLWLNHLSSNPLPAQEVPLGPVLPGFCETLIPAQYRLNRAAISLD